MKTYAQELKRKREAAGLTTRRLGDRIDKSSTFVTDFELSKKSNPPEPDVMRRLSDVLDWPVSDQLRAWGYAVNPAPVALVNPFPANDPRHELVELLKLIDFNGHEAATWHLYVAMQKRILRDLRDGEPLVLDAVEDVNDLSMSIYETTVDELA